MIKTLRITSIIAVVLAVVFFVFPAAFGVRGDKQIEQFLSSAGAIEKFKEARGDKVGDSQHEISPLVKQAEAFALYLNPPPKPKPEPSVSEVKNEPRPAGPVTAKFKLIGTSRHVLQPELSLALIDEPGKGLHWVRQLSKVGHLIIEQIKDGVVVVRDGKNTFELAVERLEKRSLLKANPSAGGRITGNNPPGATSGKEAALEKTIEAAEKMLAKVNAGQAETAQADVEAVPDSGISRPQVDAAQRNIASSKKAISDLESMRISAREARGLGRLGRRLKNVQQEPNQGEGNKPQNQRGANDVNIPGQG